MATAVVLPKVDMDQETGTVVEWLKRDGDLVKAGEPILVIETDKVSIEVEAPASGILRGIQAQPDDVIPVGTVIAYILEPDEKVPGGATRQDASKQLAKNQRVTSLDSSTGSSRTIRRRVWGGAVSRHRVVDGGFAVRRCPESAPLATGYGTLAR